MVAANTDSRLTGVSTVQAEAMFEEQFIYLYGGHGTVTSQLQALFFSFFFFLPAHTQQLTRNDATYLCLSILCWSWHTSSSLVHNPDPTPDPQ